MSQSKSKFRQPESLPAMYVQGLPAAASNGSFSGLVASSSTGGLVSVPQVQSVGQQRTTSRLRQEVSAVSSTGGVSETAGGNGGAGFSLPLPLPLRHTASSTRTTDRTDALWAEMQATLEEVELSASEGTRVFGPDHDDRLAELRQTQIALAQAWTRSEMDDEAALSTVTVTTMGDGIGTSASAAATMPTGGADGELNTNLAKTATATTMSGGRDDNSAAAGSGSTSSTAAAAMGRPSSSTGAKLEQETQVDILLARKRREANDRYFERVSQGVRDVVAKLDDVAKAMRAVEQESKDIFSENEGEGYLKG